MGKTNHTWLEIRWFAMRSPRVFAVKLIWKSTPSIFLSISAKVGMKYEQSAGLKLQTDKFWIVYTVSGSLKSVFFKKKLRQHSIWGSNFKNGTSRLWKCHNCTSISRDSLLTMTVMLRMWSVRRALASFSFCHEPCDRFMLSMISSLILYALSISVCVVFSWWISLQYKWNVRVMIRQTRPRILKENEFDCVGTKRAMFRLTWPELPMFWPTQLDMPVFFSSTWQM